jgi:hypothetical protein
MTRYFKATDGRVTVFRAPSRAVYRWAHFRTEETTYGWAPFGEISFSFGRRDGAYPTIEIDAAEYTTLRVLKARRIVLNGERAPGVLRSPQNSWVRNAELESGL